MNYFNVKSYIRLIGGITDEKGVPKMTDDDKNKILNTYKNPHIKFYLLIKFKFGAGSKILALF